MHLQSLMLLRLTVKEMHLQEIQYSTLTLAVSLLEQPRSNSEMSYSFLNNHVQIAKCLTAH